jgi:Protein of unknown function (DUF3987)
MHRSNTSARKKAKPSTSQTNRPRRTPQATIEAVIHSVRERGIAALKEPANIERLMTCDADARANINERVSRFDRGKGDCRMKEAAAQDFCGEAIASHFGQHTTSQSTSPIRAEEPWQQPEDVSVEPPRPLMRELPPADPFPVADLGDFLAPVARAIHDRVQAPVAICGQSVLAAATLALQAHANVELPMGHLKPLSNYFVTVAATGERKSAVDEEALRPIRAREAELREKYASEILTYQNDQVAWEKAREKRVRDAKGDRAKIRAALDELGPAPLRPLEPILTCGEPTYEGLCRLLAIGQPSVGIFAAEGGQFIGGHGMKDDAKLRTAAGLSLLWDGQKYRPYTGTGGHSSCRAPCCHAPHGTAGRREHLAQRSSAH